jgi:hypothetical protein
MKAGVLFTGSGPLLILTSYESFTEPHLVGKLRAKGIKKYIAFEVPLDLVKQRYGNHYNVVMGDLRAEDDLRVMDYDGHQVFNNFSFWDMGAPIYQEEQWKSAAKTAVA